MSQCLFWSGLISWRIRAYPQIILILLNVIMAAANIQRAKYEASVFSYLGVNLRKRLNQEWVASTTHRWALNVGSFSIACFSWPLGRICGINPYFLTIISLPINAASRHKFGLLLLFSGVFEGFSCVLFCLIILASSSCFRSTLSCLLALLITIARGTPCSSTSIVLLVPFFSPIRWVWANRLLS